MALIALPPKPKARIFSFSRLQQPNYNISAKSNSPTIILKHQESLNYATVIRNTQNCRGNIVSTARHHKSMKRIMPIVSAASTPVPRNENNSKFGRKWHGFEPAIPVPENEKDSTFGKIFGRERHPRDVLRIGIVGFLHLLCFLAPFTFTWSAFCVAVGLCVVTGLFGITLSFHRNLSHKSFKLPKWLEYTFAYCGVQAVQGTPIEWVTIHRHHHQFCDHDKDPHSPIKGFSFSYMTWFFNISKVFEKFGTPDNAGDLKEQPFYKLIQRTYLIHPIALGILLYALGGVAYVVWGMGVRIVWCYHLTWLVNSVCHTWGKREWNTDDLSRNSWWVALLIFGDGWHNNHHAFEYSARHGLKWWQIDMTWYVIRLLQAIGLATEVKLPTNAQKERMAIGN